MEQTRAELEDVGYEFQVKTRFVRGNLAYDVRVTYRGEPVGQRLGLAEHDVMEHAVALAREHNRRRAGRR